MFVYQKKLQYPVRIKNTNPKLAAQIITQYGGPKCNRLQKGPLQNAATPLILVRRFISWLPSNGAGLHRLSAGPVH